VCFVIKRHYNLVVQAIHRLDKELPSPDEIPGAVFESAGYDGLHGSPLAQKPAGGDPDPSQPLAVLFVGGYGGLGRHALLTLLRMFPHHFEGAVFVSVAVADSESFKGPERLEALQARTREDLVRYERFAQSLGLRAASAFAVGTEVVVEAERVAQALIKRYPRALFVGGQLIFEHDTQWNRILHNETAFMVQRRLQHAAMPMIVVPVRVDLAVGRALLRSTVAAPGAETASVQR